MNLNVTWDHFPESKLCRDAQKKKLPETPRKYLGKHAFALDFIGSNITDIRLQHFCIFAATLLLPFFDGFLLACISGANYRLSLALKKVVKHLNLIL